MKRLLTVCCLLVATNVYAQQDSTVYIGFGSKTCGYWLTAHDKKEQGDLNLMLTWAQGYIDGAAMALRGSFVYDVRTKRYEGVQELLPAEPTVADLRRFFHTASGSWFDVPQADALEHWLTKYCFDHPLVVIAEAADVLTHELMPGQHTKP